MTAIFNFLATWFGYTGSCVFSPDATCRPFLAFVALGVAATVGLVLVLMAYRRAQQREASELEARRAHARALQAQERIRRAVLPQAIRRNPPLRSELPAAI
jgi:hypothetical protein